MNRRTETILKVLRSRAARFMALYGHKNEMYNIDT